MSDTNNATTQKHHMRPKLIGLTLALVACLIVGAVAVGKYVNQVDNTSSVNAKEFYFSSDLLDGNTHTLAPGEDITFTLGNNKDELRYSEVDVKYEVKIAPQDENVNLDNISVKVGDNVASNDSESETSSDISTITGTINAGKDNNKEITISGLPDGTYTISAVGYSGSSKESGYFEKLEDTEFTIKSENPVVYKTIEADNDYYVLLTVWSEGYKGEVAIDFSSISNKVIPDSTDSVMSGLSSTDTSITDSSSFEAQTDMSVGYNSHTYRFFKTGTDENITADNFTVKYTVNNVEKVATDDTTAQKTE